MGCCLLNFQWIFLTNIVEFHVCVFQSSDGSSPDQAQITAEIKQLRSESLKLRMEQVSLQVCFFVYIY